MSGAPTELRVELTPLGAFLAHALAIGMVIAASADLEVLVWISCLTLAQIFTVWIYLRRTLRGVRVDLALPPRVHAGTHPRVELVLSNTGRLPVLDPDVVIAVGQTFQAGARPAPALGASVRIETEVTGLVSHRGHYRSAEISVASTLMGLVTGTAYFQQPIDLVVFPAVTTLERRTVPAGSAFSREGEKSIDRPGTDLEVVGFREYVPGDSPRWIHWPALARTGKLFVKQFARNSETDVTVAVEMTDSPLLEFSILEEALVSIAASLLLHAHQRGLRTQLILATGTDVVVPSGSGDLHHSRLLSALTFSRSGNGKGLPKVLEAHDELLVPSTLLFTVGLSSARSEALNRYLGGLAGRGVRSFQLEVDSSKPIRIWGAPEVFHSDHEVTGVKPAMAPVRRSGNDRVPILALWRVSQLAEVMENLA